MSQSVFQHHDQQQPILKVPQNIFVFKKSFSLTFKFNPLKGLVELQKYVFSKVNKEFWFYGKQ